MSTNNRKTFSDFIELFLERYTVEEFQEDLKNLSGEIDEELRITAESYFADEKKSNAAEEAVLSVRFDGITTRTIRNWKSGGKIYSEHSSKALNAYFNEKVPSGARISRRKLAWLWLAFKLKLNDQETDTFFKDCIGERRIYGLDLQEVILRTFLHLEGSALIKKWEFFDAVCFAIGVYEEVVQDSVITDSYTEKVLAALCSSNPDPKSLASALSLVYEEALNKLIEMLPELPPEALVTKMIEECWNQDKSCFLPIERSDNSVEELKTSIRNWAISNRSYFCTAYLSWFLMILNLLISNATAATKETKTNDYFIDWYFGFSKILATKERIRSFPKDVLVMRDKFEYEEGESFAAFTKKKAVTYFSRLLDAPMRASRSKLIEYWFAASIDPDNIEELNDLLERHLFRPLDEKEEIVVSEKLFRWKW